MKNKKLSKLFLMTIMGVCAMFVTTIKANAATNVHLNGIRIICEPRELEAGKQAECYVVGKIDGTEAVHGYVAEFYTTDHLTVVGSNVNSNVKDSASSKIVRPSDPTAGSSLPGALATFKCNPTAKVEEKMPASPRDSGCILYYSKEETGKVFNTTSLKKPANLDSNVATEMGTTLDGVLGSITVKLDAENNVSKCGNLCYMFWAIPTIANYANYESCQSENTADCGENPPAPSPSSPLCEEIPMKKGTPEVTETGSFVSYTILVAGILLAICAVAIAKKNNRLQKI